MTYEPEILTYRLRLVTPTLDAAPEVFECYGQDPAVSRYMSWVPARSIDDTISFLSRFISDNAEMRGYGFLIRCRASGELRGSIGGVVERHRMQFGYCLARRVWGHGYATEAATAFVNAALRLPGLWRIQAFCDTENTASARVLEKSGLEHEGTLRRYMTLPNMGSEPRDMHCYAKVRPSAIVASAAG